LWELKAPQNAAKALAHMYGEGFASGRALAQQNPGSHRLGCELSSSITRPPNPNLS